MNVNKNRRASYHDQLLHVPSNLLYVTTYNKLFGTCKCIILTFHKAFVGSLITILWTYNIYNKV